MTYHFGPFTLDPRRVELCRDGAPVSVAPKAFSLLACLLEAAPAALSKENLFEAVWPGVTVSENALNQVVLQARRALGEEGGEVLATVRGHGYRIGVPVEARPAGRQLPVAPWHQRIRRRSLAIAGVVLALISLAGWRLAAAPERSAPPVPTMAIPISPPPRAVAVLPFTDLSAGQDRSYVAVGLVDEMIDRLARSPDLRVAGRAPTQALVEGKHSAVEMGRMLQVGSLVEGTVEVDGELVRVGVRILDASNGQHLWSQRYERPLAELPDIVAVGARDVQSALFADATAGNSWRRQHRPDFRAYEAYLRGRAAYRLRSKNGDEEAIAHYERSIEIDAAFPDSHVALASALAHLWGIHSSEPRDGPILARAENAVRRALELQQDHAEAHRVLGGILLSRHRDWASAESARRRALELDPNAAGTRWAYGLHLMRLGRLSEARPHLYGALERDPLSPTFNALVGRLHLYQRDYENALAFVHRSLELNPEDPVSVLLLAMIYTEMGDDEEAREAFLRLVPGPLRGPGRVVTRLLGNRRSLATLYALAEFYTGDPCLTQAPTAANILAFLGEEDRMFECLEREVRERHAWYIKVNPMLAPYRADPRYAELLELAGIGSR